MAASLPEKPACINVDADEFEKFEIPGINSTLLMSFLEESQANECDDERLNGVIRSLEADIDPNMMMNRHDLSMDDIEWASKSEGCQSLDAGLPHLSDFDFNWVDMEIAPSSTSDEMTNWYMEPIEGIIEFGGVGDYSYVYYGVPLEEHAYGSSLWQETYASEIYE